MIEFSPVWVSSQEQLHRLMDAYTPASALRKTLGSFHVPPGTAHIRGVLMPWMRVPIVYVAEGRLTIANGLETFHRAALTASVPSDR